MAKNKNREYLPMREDGGGPGGRFHAFLEERFQGEIIHKTRTRGLGESDIEEEELDEAHFSKVKNASLSNEEKKMLFLGKPKAVQDHFGSLWGQIQFATDQDRLLISLLTPERLLEFVRYFIIFDFYKNTKKIKFLIFK